MGSDATLGQIGFSERSGYTAIGTVCNLAARLCAEAKDGQILISSRIAEAVEAVAKLEDLGNLELKGLRRPVAARSARRRDFCNVQTFQNACCYAPCAL
jgi:class 3 adenylate cyclase